MRTTLQRIATVTSGLVIAGLLTGCAGGFDRSSTPAVPSPTPGAIPTPPTTNTNTRSAATAMGGPTLPPDVVGRLTGFEVEVISSSIDPATDLVRVVVLLTNSAGVDESFADIEGKVLLDPGEGADLVALGAALPEIDILAGSSVRCTLLFRAPPEASLGHAVLVLGQGAPHHQRLPRIPSRTAGHYVLKVTDAVDDPVTAPTTLP